MFTRTLVSQALIDATKAIMEEDEKKRLILEPELDETGFHKAAHAARKAGQSHFEFQGKKYPVTSKSHSEGMVPPEKIGGQVLKKHDDKAAAKGHSATVRPVEEEDEKKSSNPFDVLKGKYVSQLPKKKGELTGHEHKKTSTGDVYTKKYKKDPEDMKEESHPDEKEDKALVKKMVKPSALKKEEEKETHLSKHTMTNEKYVTPPEARKIADQEVHKHEKNMHKGKKETKLGEEEERHMTPSEKEKREKIVKSMKKGLKGFKDRYGDRAKNVMYATATKQAMKEDIGGISTIAEKKKKVEMKEDEHVRVDGETDMNTKTVDGLRGRMKVPATYHNKTKSYKVGLTVGEEYELDEMDKSQKSQERHGDYPLGIKNKDANMVKSTTSKKVNKDTLSILQKKFNQAKAGKLKEEVEIDEDIKGTLKKIGNKVLDKLGHGSDEDMIKDLQKKMGMPQTGKKPTQKEEVEVDETFKGPEAGSGTGDHPFVTNENSPMKLVKDLAKKSYKKIRQETMMGKIAGGV